eukprot:6188877-Pleurochrysis_carterae.AAC.2
MRRKASAIHAPQAIGRALGSLARAYFVLLRIKYAAADDTTEDDGTAALDAMSAAQGGIRHIEPEPEPAQRGTKRRVRTQVTMGGSSSTQKSPPPPPPPPQAEQQAQPETADAGRISDDDDQFVHLDSDSLEGEVGGEAAEEFIPYVGAECKAEDLKSASKASPTFRRHLALVASSDRRRVPSKGRAWASAMRAHSGESMAFTYTHMSAAHLKELIVRHGMLERSEDEILERDNRTAKRKTHDLLYWGGSSNPRREK